MLGPSPPRHYLYLSTRQPFRRRHQALPARAGASGGAARLMRRRLSRLLAGATRSAAPRLIECGFLSSFPGARAQAFHADTTPQPNPTLTLALALTLALTLPLTLTPNPKRRPSTRTPRRPRSARARRRRSP